MATSPNFSWPEPDNTDLVKNGALAIRTAINAIDTSMVDLKGGTTGQVLAKASGTDMDFSWVTDATGIPATIFDAKGDIIAATAADTASRLAVGANDTVLTADSTAATGLKWATPSSGMTNPLTTTGDTIYSSSGSTPARLGIGTTGQVLTVASGIPSWATPAGGTTTYTLINTGGTSLSGSSTSVSGLSGYNKLFVRIVGASCNSINMGMKVNFNADTGSDKYLYSSIVGGYATTSEFNSQTTIYWNETISPGASSVTYDAFFLIDGANSSGVKPFWGASTASTYANSLYRSNTGIYTGTSVISSVEVKVVYTTSFDAGTVYIYGAN